MFYVRYFVLVGAALLGALFVVDGYLPRPEAVRDRREVDKSTIRISSAVSAREKVVLDTTLPTIMPQIREILDINPAATPPIANSSREALAQIVPSPRPAVKAIPRKNQTRRIAVTRRPVANKTREASLSEQPSNFFEGWFR